MRTLYICGAGNAETVRLALTINRQQAHWDQIVLLDDDPAKRNQSILGVRIEGPFDLLREGHANSAEVVNSVTRTTTRRWAAGCRIETFGLRPATLIHPTVDKLGAELGRDVLVYQNAVVGPQVTVGDSSVIFMGAVVGHESLLGRCCIVAANAVINARVRLGEGAYVGSNATILPEIKIGPWATIGASSMVFQDVPAGATVMGVPGKVIFKLTAQQLEKCRSAPVPRTRGKVDGRVDWSVSERTPSSIS